LDRDNAAVGFARVVADLMSADAVLEVVELLRGFFEAEVEGLGLAMSPL
jgi:hypothetical protein